jgi:drug/metabolite transporter (DMT)-like permease
VSARHAALLALLAAIWGASYLLIRWALDGFSPAEVVFVRTALGAAALYALLRAQPPADVERPRWPLALLLGVTQVAAPFLLISFGEQVVPSGLTAVLIASSPIFVALLAPVLDNAERAGRTQAAGLVVGICGVAVLVGGGTVGSLEGVLGALGMIGAAACYALGAFVVKGPYGRVPPLETSFISLATAALLTLPLAVATARPDAPGLRALLAMLVLGVVGTAVAFVIYYQLITEAGAARAALVSYLTPGLALGYGAVLLGERITVAAIAGLVLILAGVALASRRTRVVLAEP